MSRSLAQRILDALEDKEDLSYSQLNRRFWREGAYRIHEALKLLKEKNMITVRKAPSTTKPSMHVELKRKDIW